MRAGKRRRDRSVLRLALTEIAYQITRLPLKEYTSSTGYITAPFDRLLNVYRTSMCFYFC